MTFKILRGLPCGGSLESRLPEFAPEDLPPLKWGKLSGHETAQGIEAVSFFACGKKDLSG
jgi:hypothetical protein